MTDNLDDFLTKKDLIEGVPRRDLVRALLDVAEAASMCLNDECTTIGVQLGEEYDPAKDRTNFHRVKVADMWRLRKAFEALATEVIAAIQE